MNGKIKLSAAAAKAFGLAYVFGGIPVLSEVIVENISDKRLKNLKLTVSSDDDFALFSEIDIPFINSGESLRFTDFPSPKAEYLSKISENKNIGILISVSEKSEVLEAISLHVELCPPNVWLGISFPKNIIASFINPSDYHIKDIFSKELSEIENILYKERLSFDDITEIAKKSYDALLSAGFSEFKEIESSLEKQQIRSSSEIFNTKTISRLEFALIYSGLLEKCRIYGTLFLSETEISVKIEKGRNFFIVSSSVFLKGASFEENIGSDKKSEIKESVLCNISDCRKKGILPINNYDIYASSWKKSLENIFSEKAPKENIEGTEYVSESSPSLRRAARFIKNDGSFIFDISSFSDENRIFKFISKRFIEYGKTATFLFETEEEKNKFEKSISELFPDDLIQHSGAVSLDLISKIFSTVKESASDFFKNSELLKKEENKIYYFSDLLKGKQPCGLSFSDAVSLADKYSDIKPPFRLTNAYIENLTAEDFETDLSLCESFSELSYKLKDLKGSDFEKFGFSEVSEYDAETLKTLFKKRSESAEKIEKLAELSKEVIGIEIDSYEKWIASVSLFELLLSGIYVPESLVEYNRLYEISDIVKDVSEAGRLRDLSEKFLCENFNRDIFTYNADAALKQWGEATEKRSVVRNFEYGKIKKAISAFAYDPSKIKNEDVLLILEKLCEYRENRDKVLTLGASVAPVFGVEWNRGYCDWNNFENCYKNACAVRKILDIFSYGNTYKKEVRISLLSKINSEIFKNKYEPFFKAVISEFKAITECEKEISKYSSFDFSELYKKEPFKKVLNITSGISESLNFISDWCERSKIREKLVERGLFEVVSVIEENPETNENAVPFYLKAAAVSVLSLYLKNSRKILKYGDSFFKKRIERFISAKQNIISCETSAIFDLSISRALKNPSFETEISFLKKEAENKKEIAISKLRKNCPVIYNTLFPINAIFKSSSFISEEKDFLVAVCRNSLNPDDISKILKSCSSVILSADLSVNKGELISLAEENSFDIIRYNFTADKVNEDLALWAKKYIYDDNLKILPSAHYLKNKTVCVNGKSNNGINAEEIAEIYSQLTNICRSSDERIQVKIAAFSKKQAKAIKFFIDKKMSLPKNVSVTIETFCGSSSECDYLILTTVFSGDLSELKYFTDIENVISDNETVLRYLISAKKQILFVSSFDEDTLKSFDLHIPSLFLLKNFWLYSLGVKGKTPKPFKNPYIGKFTQNKNIYADILIRNQIAYKKSDFIDNLYLSSSESCILYDISENIIEDAETEKKLSKRGFSVFREFSTDRLSSLFLSGTHSSEGNKTKTEPNSETEDHADFYDAEFLRYTICNFDNKPNLSENAEEFMANYNNPDIRKDILSVVKAESPVSLHTLSKRVLSHWGIARCGIRLENKILSLAEKLDVYIENSGGIKFFWNSIDEKKHYEVFRIPDESERREITDISPEELANVYKYIAKEYKIITIAKAEQELIKILGFMRVTDKVRKHLSLSLEIAEKRGLLKTVKGKIIGNDR